MIPTTRQLALLAGCFILSLSLGCTNSYNADYEDDNDQEEEWVVRVKGGEKAASLLAHRSGYSYSGPVIGFKDTYMWHKTNRSIHFYRKRGSSTRMQYNNLNQNSKIIWADQQVVLKRQKRDLISMDELEYSSRYQKPRRASFNDELWDQEWYLEDLNSKSSRSSEEYNNQKLDLNVMPVYEMGITGRGVRVAVLDDGLEYTHEDLRKNYDPEISYDVTDRDSDPAPIYREPAYSHGTRCAGEIAMEANNQKCGVGVAFEARIGGIKMLDGTVNDRVEAESLGYRTDLIDVYTASWGPPDDGKSLMAPGRLTLEAFERGISEGRAGRGSIYVWASGNGGTKSDHCGCDGYVNSIYTIAIGSASQTGSFPWYGEICPATLATTYSSGANQDRMIVTTDLNDTCTTSHTGTSASAPLAAGIIALALQANQNLTWRDVQHLTVYTSYYGPLRENVGWFRNGAGLWFNPRFGFGLIDAYALVTLSKNWTSVGEKSTCVVHSSISLLGSKIRYGWPQKVEFETERVCPRGARKEINFLEHVQVEANIEYSNRGALQIHLTSPSGTTVQILGSRKLDDSTEGFSKWSFMSVATWGENPHGTWSLDVHDQTGEKKNIGTLGILKLILHGTKERPPSSQRPLYKTSEVQESLVNLQDNLGGSSTNDESNFVDEESSSRLTKNRSDDDVTSAAGQINREDWLVQYLLS